MGKAAAGKRICVGCRVTVLSRYNPDPVCAACVRAAREASGIVPGWVWDSAPLRAALARVDLAAFAALVRRASRLSLEGLGALVGEGWSKSLMSLIERGSRDTLYDLRKLLAFVDAVGMPRTALAPLILGDPDATLEAEEIAALWGVDTMELNRRGFAAMSAGLASAAVVSVPARVDWAHVRYLQAALVRLRDQDDVVGGGGVLPQCLRLFAQARRMLDESDHSAAVGQQLLVVTADLGIKSAWSAYDVDNQGLARRLYEQSALLADSADDGGQRAYLYANMVQQSTCLARHTGRKDLAREALRFAGRAQDAARAEPSPALHSLIALRRSLAHAQLGDEAAFRSAIATARRELDRGPHEADLLHATRSPRRRRTPLPDGRRSGKDEQHPHRPADPRRGPRPARRQRHPAGAPRRAALGRHRGHPHLRGHRDDADAHRRPRHHRHRRLHLTAVC
ncbi:MAG: hypothetical protein ACRDRH_14825 [Pseudonocardia sp.]